MIVCNMRRIIINWLLLVSLAAAVPGARHKRHLSYLTNLFRSSLYGQDQDESSQLDYSVTEPQYKLYQVPGYDDILIKSVTSAPVIVKTVLNDPGDVVDPFDTYIGTSNPEGSLVALQHVNNLISTGILNGQQTNLLKETIVPMTSDINLIPQDNIGSVPVISESIKPIQTEVVENSYGEDDNLVDTFNPTYSYKQVEVTNPQVIVKQEFDQPANIPPCVEQRIEEVVEKVLPVVQYPTVIVFVKDTNQINNLFNSSKHAKEHAHNYTKSFPLTPKKEQVGPRGYNTSHNFSNETVNNGSTPINPFNTNNATRGTEEVPPKGTLAYYIYEHEHINRKPFSKVENKSEVHPNSIRYVYIAPDYKRLAKEDRNIAKTATADNAKVIADNNNAPRQSNPNGSSVSVQENEDGIPVNVNGMPSKGRGDIPGE